VPPKCGLISKWGRGVIHTTAEKKDRSRPNLKLKPEVSGLSVAELLEHAKEHAPEYAADLISDATMALELEMGSPVTAETVTSLLEKFEGDTKPDDPTALFVHRWQTWDAKTYLEGLLQSENPIRRVVDRITQQFRS
jgi:hypothetical protein